ncbi:MAG: ATP-binding protein [Proteobacteria bacterium]|nr:ATP-binding protein [Pseudomonadota bacterium]
MERSLKRTLLDWKNDSSRKPILLRGARQVGKSFLIKEFGRTFDRYVEFNFDFDRKLATVFEPDSDPERIVKELSIAAEKRIVPGDTLLFLDEIQECPNAIRALRYFYENMADLHVIAAGSLLDFVLDNIGVPVGRIQMLYLYPLSFVEFLKAKEKTLLWEHLSEHDRIRPLPEFMHNHLLKLYGEYMAIGGMPEVVDEWLANADLKKTRKIQRSLIETYKADFGKYASKYQKPHVETVYSAVPRLTGKKFVFTSVAPEVRSRELRPAMDLLGKAGVIHVIPHSSSSGLPLAAEINPKLCKVILSDIGLMQAMLDYDCKSWILEPEKAATDFGAVVESFVGQEILAYSSPDQKCGLFYWAREKRGSSAEVDYVAELRGEVVPIEVKAGRSSALKSMNLFLEEKSSSPYGLHFSQKNFSSGQTVRNYPLYSVFKAFM